MSLLLDKDVPLISPELLNPWRLPKAAELETFRLEGLRLILPGFVIVAMIAAVMAVVGITL